MNDVSLDMNIYDHCMCFLFGPLQVSLLIDQFQENTIGSEDNSAIFQASFYFVFNVNQCR